MNNPVPNKRTSNFFLYGAGLGMLARMEFINALGQRVIDKTVSVTAGNLIYVPVQELGAGLYQVKLSGPDQSSSARLLIAR